MRRILMVLTLLAGAHWLAGGDPYPLNKDIDALSYRFEVTLSDRTDEILGVAQVRLNLKSSMTSFSIDLASQSGDGRGMTVGWVKMNGHKVSFSHMDSRLQILPGKPVMGEQVLVIQYRGIPRDGLIISRNLHGSRTFFSDHYPDRAHEWLPTVDHLSDKAACEFVVTAPWHYEVIASGLLKEEIRLGLGLKKTHWIEAKPISTKVMAMAAADFSVTDVSATSLPHQIWCYPKDSASWNKSFAPSARILEFFESFVGPYPFNKLYHVQSKTRWGGMENAGNIFYAEDVVGRNSDVEGLIAHETAHQWFGNSAAEADWHHVWLSEGFATYCTALYYEHEYGRSRMRREMNDQREDVVRYNRFNSRPVLDTTITDLSNILSTAVYQKASWVLHMLRQQVGDSAFHRTMKKYYSRFAGSNALTSDFVSIAETESGTDLRPFFDQWLTRPGIPELEIRWRYDSQTREVIITGRQVQSQRPFWIDLELTCESAGSTVTRGTMKFQDRRAALRLPSPTEPDRVVLDPDTLLLFKGAVSRE